MLAVEKILHKFVKELDSLPFDALPTVGVDWAGLAQLTTNISTSLDDIAKFSLNGRANPESERDGLINNLSSQYDQQLNAFLPYIPYLTLRSAQVFNIVQESKQLLADTTAKCSQAVKQLTDQKETMDNIVQAAKDAAAKIGVAKFATKFEAIAEDHEKFSFRWLIASVVTGIITLLLTGVVVGLGPDWPTKIPENASAFPYVLTKLAFLSVLYFMTIWTARNYRSHRHLGVVNRHRQNALSTFETFTEASKDTETKDAVLLEATRCIFSPGVSGYLGKGLEPPAHRAVDIIKLIGSGE